MAIVAGCTVASVSRKAALVSEALNVPCDSFTKSVSLITRCKVKKDTNETALMPSCLIHSNTEG